MESIRPKIGDSEVNAKVDNVDISFENTISETQEHNINSQKSINTVTTPMNTNSQGIEIYDFEENDDENKTITIGGMTITIERINDEDSQITSNKQEINTNPISIYTDFMDEHGNTDNCTFGVDQGILSKLNPNNIGLIDFNVNDILYDPSIEEKSLAEVFQERGNLSTVEGINTLTDALIKGIVNTNDAEIISSLIIYISEAAPQATQEEVTQKLLSLCTNLNESTQYNTENNKFNFLLNKLTERGFSEEDAIFIIENLDSVGACTYAATANAIITQLMNNPEQFQKIFGFPMYDPDGTFNGEELILDLYLFANSEENGGNLFIQDPNDPNKMIINYDENNIDKTMANQVYISTSIGIKSDLLENYMKSKGTLLTISASASSLISDGKEVIETVQDAIENGNAVSIDIYPKEGVCINITQINEDGTTRSGIITGAHAVFITGITENNELVISSWGKKYIITIDQLDLANVEVNGIKLVYSLTELHQPVYN